MSYYYLDEYELIILAKSNNEEALDLLFLKYSNFIYLIINNYKVKKIYLEDFYQEGLCVLYEAILKYDDSFSNSFLYFFSILLKRRFAYLISELYRYKGCIIKSCNKLEEDTCEYVPKININYEAIYKIFDTDLERLIFKAIYIEEYSINEIALKYEYNPKQIYNAIYRIKEKLKRAKDIFD